ncbi:MAG TPA: universal stress protein [Gemmataceae bacterium]|nr:universal stress protein [Gemmataceae bacterium]
MYRSILVPLDGSTFGEQALPLAIAVARRAGAALHLLHVHTPLASVYAEGAFFIDEALERDLKVRQQTYLESVTKRVKDVCAIPIHPTLVEGAIEPSIRSAAVGAAADLVVMTTHGRGPLARLWLGSVADALVRDLPVPLLLVRPGEGAIDFAQEPPLKHLLLPLDGEPLAEQMIEPAVALGSLSDADYTLLRVIRPIVPLAYPFSEGHTLGQVAQSMINQIDEFQNQVRKEATDYLERVAAGLRQRSLRVQTRVAVETQPAVAILSEAKPPAIDMIAVETHGRRGLKRLFLGSVADKVVRGAAVPVLVQRPAHP